MSWIRLADANAWEEFKAVHMWRRPPALAGVSVAWGIGPAEYPCLVTAVEVPIDGSRRMLTAYVYPKDARLLLESSPAPAASGNPPPTQRKPDSHDAQFRDWIISQQLTLAYYCVESGLCTKEAYEEKLSETREQVKNWQKEQMSPDLGDLRTHHDLPDLPGRG